MGENSLENLPSKFKEGIWKYIFVLTWKSLYALYGSLYALYGSQTATSHVNHYAKKYYLSLQIGIMFLCVGSFEEAVSSNPSHNSKRKRKRARVKRHHKAAPICFFCQNTIVRGL